MIIPFYRFLEVGLYPLLRFAAFMFLAVYPFRRQMRFSLVVSTMLTVVVCVIQICLGLLSTFSSLNPNILSAVSTAVYAVFFFAIVKDRIGRLAFILLVLLNVANLVETSSKALEFLLFPALAAEPYRWSLCLCLFIVQVIITIPLGLYIAKHFTYSIPQKTSGWSFLWIMPAIFYMLWYYHLHFTGHGSPQEALDIHNLIFLLFINVGAFVVYHTTILLLQALEKAQQLTEQNHLLSMHQLQYDNLQQRINEARQAKHDVRHHTLLMREYLRNGKIQELEAYLDNYAATLPEMQALVYCRHYATNALLGYFYQQAKSQGIELDVFLQLPEKINLPETTLSVVLGNLLENAIDACREVPSANKRITVRGKANMGSIFFEITNPYAGDVRKTKSGSFRSTKAKGQGLGLESVAQLAKHHGGMLELDAMNGVFRASILLTEQPEKPE